MARNQRAFWIWKNDFQNVCRALIRLCLSIVSLCHVFTEMRKFIANEMKLEFFGICFSTSFLRQCMFITSSHVENLPNTLCSSRCTTPQMKQTEEVTLHNVKAAFFCRYCGQEHTSTISTIKPVLPPAFIGASALQRMKNKKYFRSISGKPQLHTEDTITQSTLPETHCCRFLRTSQRENKHNCQYIKRTFAQGHGEPHRVMEVSS